MGGVEGTAAPASPAVRPAAFAGSTSGVTSPSCDDSFEPFEPFECSASFASFEAFASPETFGFFELLESSEPFEIFGSVETSERLGVFKTFESSESLVSLDSVESSRGGGTGGLSSTLTLVSMETVPPCSPPPPSRVCALCASVGLATPGPPLSWCFGGALNEGSNRSGLKRTTRLQCNLR